MSIWARVLDVEGAVVDRVLWDGLRTAVVAYIALPRRAARRLKCGLCEVEAPRYDAGRGVVEWRTLDLGAIRAFVRSEHPRVECATHGVVACAVPWARAGARFTKGFDDAVAWLATQCSKTAVGEWMRVAWRTVGRMIARVVAERDRPEERLEGLRRIGIDEVSYRKGWRYLTVVVDHDRKRIVWMGEGHDEATVCRFFDALGPERCARIEVVTADAAQWIRNAVTGRCPRAKVCLDRFHIVQWATDALDVVRRQVWNQARKAGQESEARTLKGARWALWKNPKDLTTRQQAKLADIAKTNEPLYRAYLLKEQLRQVFHLPANDAKSLLDRWLDWARRAGIEAFRRVARTVTERRTEIDNALDLGMSNALVESTNTKIRLIARRAFGFHSASALIALAMLCLGGMCPDLPGRGPSHAQPPPVATSCEQRPYK